jgi:hypothetical protein
MLIPRVVGLHDIAHGNWVNEVRELGFGSPCEVRSFTDLVDRDNPHNDGLAQAAFWSNVLAIQEDLLYPVPTAAARLAINSSLISSVGPAQLYAFDRNYQFRALPFEENFALGSIFEEDSPDGTSSPIHDKLTDEEGDT